MTQDVAGNGKHDQLGYPIVARHALSEARPRGPMGLRAPRRSTQDMVRPKDGHHVLVYKVDGDYILDNVSLGHRDEQIVRASHVSVVDMRRDAPVMVEFGVPTRDSDEFTVRVTFGCTVVDPIAVVRDGITDPRDILDSYLKSYHNVMQMGLEFDLDQINEVRRSIDDELTAYRTVTPPHIEGFRVLMASIEVLTPEEMRRRSQTKRGMRDEYSLASDRLGYWTDYELARTTSQHGVAMAMQMSQQEHELRGRDFNDFVERRRQDQFDEMAVQRQRAELRRQAEVQDFRRAQLREAAELIRSDPDMALYLAYVEGQANPLALADQLRADRDRRALRVEAEADKDREERREREREEYDQKRQAMEYDQVERMEKFRAQREEAQVERERTRRLAILAEERAMLELNWEREDKVESAKANREEIRHQVDREFQILRDLIQRGHFDTSELDLPSIVAHMAGGSALVSKAPAEAIEGPTATTDAHPEGDHDR